MDKGGTQITRPKDKKIDYYAHRREDTDCMCQEEEKKTCWHLRVRKCIIKRT